MAPITALLGSMALLAAAAAGSWVIRIDAPYRVLDVRLDGLPYALRGFTGVDEPLSDSVYSVLANDHNLHRRYSGPDGRTLWLYIGYYGTAKGGRPSHVPQTCYTGQGYSIERWDQVPAPAGEIAGEFNRLVVRRHQERQAVLFWFQGQGNLVLKGGLDQNLARFSNRLLGRRDDGALIRLSMSIPPGGEQRTEQDLSAFAAELLRHLPKHWPVEARS